MLFFGYAKPSLAGKRTFSPVLVRPNTKIDIGDSKSQGVQTLINRYDKSNTTAKISKQYNTTTKFRCKMPSLAVNIMYNLCFFSP